MKRILFSVLALGAMTGAALAEPQKMNETQLEGIAGGVSADVAASNWLYQSAFALALGGNGNPAAATAGNTATLSNSSPRFGATVDSTDTILPSMPAGTGGVAPPVSIEVPAIDLGDMNLPQ